MKRTRIACGIAWLIILSLSFGGCKKPVPQEVIRPVRAMKVADVKDFQGRGYPGRAKPVEEVELSFRVSGPLISLPIDVGQRVKKGQTLAVIDPTDFETALNLAKSNLQRAEAELLIMQRGARSEEIQQLKATLDEAQAVYKQSQAEFERMAKLRPDNVVSQSEYDLALARRDRSKAQVEKARQDLIIGQQGAREEERQAKQAEIKALQSAVTDAQNRLNYATLRAPFEGDIAAKYVENFQTVQAKQPIVRLLDVSKIEVVVQIPENFISMVPLVKDVVCTFDAFPGKEFIGKVTEIGTEATHTTRTYPVTVRLDQPKNKAILPGMAATIRGRLDPVVLKKLLKITIPASAIFTPETEKQSYVWVVDEATGTVDKKPIKTGQLTPTGVAVLEGLKTGEWIVTAGVHSLTPGQKVRPLEEGGN